MKTSLKTSERLTVTVREAIRMTGLSQPTFYRLMKEGRLKYTHVGRRRLINMESLHALLDQSAT